MSATPAPSQRAAPGSFAHVQQRVGVLGGGQLGRMMAQDASRLGVQLTVLDPQPACPAALVGAQQLVGPFTSASHVQQLGERVSVVTMEIEHVNVAALDELERAGVTVQPSADTIRVIQDKYRQKVHLQQHGVQVGPFMECGTLEECRKAGGAFGYPLMLKSKREAYDGKGNAVVKSEADLPAALTALRQTDPSSLQLYAEKWVPFTQELAVMVARDIHGRCSAYPCVSTTQQDNICHTVYAPARHVSAATARAAEQLAVQAISSFTGAGMYGVEMFLVGQSELLLNEIAPRPHNSGHYTIEACYTSQFEQHIRCVTSLPLGSCRMRVGAAVMINVLGSGNEEADVERSWLPCKAALDVEGAHVHWYGKQGVRQGRKLGHITFDGATEAEVDARVNEWQQRLAGLQSQPAAGVVDGAEGHTDARGALGTEGVIQMMSELKGEFSQDNSATAHPARRAVSPPVLTSSTTASSASHTVIPASSFPSSLDPITPFDQHPSHPSQQAEQQYDVGIIMGSDSDLKVMRAAADVLSEFGVSHRVEIKSAHRTPLAMVEYAQSAQRRGVKVIIAGAGGAAHLPGMVAAMTPLPVIGVPVPQPLLDGMDSLLSIVQMPKGVPVATVAIGNATNAGLLAVRMLGATDGRLWQRMEAWMERQKQEVERKNERMVASGYKEYTV